MVNIVYCFLYHNNEFDRPSRFKDWASELCPATCKCLKYAFVSSGGKATMCAQFLHSSNLGIYIFKPVEVLLILNCIDYDLRAIFNVRKLENILKSFFYTGSIQFCLWIKKKFTIVLVVKASDGPMRLLFCINYFK